MVGYIHKAAYIKSEYLQRLASMLTLSKWTDGVHLGRLMNVEKISFASGWSTGMRLH
jgi:hypothetical protein